MDALPIELSRFEQLFDYCEQRGFRVRLRFVDEYGRPLPEQAEHGVRPRRQFAIDGVPGGVYATESVPGGASLDAFGDSLLEQLLDRCGA